MSPTAIPWQQAAAVARAAAQAGRARVGVVVLAIEPGRNGPSQPALGVQAGRKALRIRHKNGVKVRKKRPRGGQEEAQGV